MNSFKSKIRLADFENQHYKRNSSVLWSQQLINVVKCNFFIYPQKDLAPFFYYTPQKTLFKSIII